MTFLLRHGRASVPSRAAQAWRVGALASCLLSACEPELGVDASLDAAQDGALDVPGDGAPPTRGDAGPRDAGSGDAGDPVGRDAGGMDASADAGTLDAAQPEGGPGPTDASAGDAAIDASVGDGAVSARTHSGEVVWNVVPAQGTAFCPYQSIAVWKQESVTLVDPGGSPFYCPECEMAPIPEEVTFQAGGEITVYLTFRKAVLSDLTTAGMRANLVSSKMDWWTEPKTPLQYPAGFPTGIGTGHWQQPGPAVEILGYAPPLLHVRLRGLGLGQSSTLRQEATLPYACVVHGKFGDFPSICSEVDCTYVSDGPANGSEFTADLTLPLKVPAP